MSLAITLLMSACYPRGDDDSVMGPGEKLVGTWIEDDTEINALYHIAMLQGWRLLQLFLV